METVRSTGLGSLSALPDALICFVMFNLGDVRDVLAVAQSSRLLRVYAYEEQLWVHLCLRQHDGRLTYQATWRQTALSGLRRAGRAIPDAAWQSAALAPPAVPGFSSDFLFRRWYRCHLDLATFAPPLLHLERVDARGMAPAELLRRFDAPCLPALLGGLVDDWPASEWQFPRLSERLGAAEFRVSSPVESVTMTLAAYRDYVSRQHDEEPLYVFDDTCFDRGAADLLTMYRTPHVFDQDLLSALGEGTRPPHRWIVLGPARSGASWHVDPFLTSAWNTLMQGRKRWALYPPDVVPPGVSRGQGGGREDDLTSLQWFLEVYPLLPLARRPFEFVQAPGETVFVPGGWWHCVLNLDDAQVAVTQNFVSSANIERAVANMALGTRRCNLRVASHYTAGAVQGWRDMERACGLEGPLPPALRQAANICAAAAEKGETVSGGPHLSATTLSRKRSGATAAEGDVVANSASPPAKAHRTDAPAAAACVADVLPPSLAALIREPCNSDKAAVLAVSGGTSSAADGGGGGGEDNSRGSSSGGEGSSSSDSSSDSEGDEDEDGPARLDEVSVSVQLHSRSAPAGPRPTQERGAACDRRLDCGLDKAEQRSSAQAAAVAAPPGRACGPRPAQRLLPTRVFERSGFLGRWLHQLCDQRPDLRLMVLAVAQKQLHLPRWRALLDAICTAGGTGRWGGSAAELLPLSGATSLVWLVGGTAVKLYTERPELARLMCHLEAHLYGVTSTATHPTVVPPWLTRGICFGSVTVTAATPPATAAAAAAAATAAAAAAAAAATPMQLTAAHAPLASISRETDTAMPHGGAAARPRAQHMPATTAAAQTLPFLVSDQVCGTALFGVLPTLTPAGRLAAAKALGRLLAHLHLHGAQALLQAGEPSLPPQLSNGRIGRGAGGACPAPPPPDGPTVSPCTPAAVEVDWLALLEGGHTLWHDREGSVWTSQHGLLASRRSGAAVRRRARPDAALEAGSAGGAAAAAAVTAATRPRPSRVLPSAPASPAAATCTLQPVVAGAAARPAAPPPSAPLGVPDSWAGVGAAARRWLPFVEYLRMRRREMSRELAARNPAVAGDRSWMGLPARLLPQLEAYLPLDPAPTLLGGSSSTTAPRSTAHAEEGCSMAQDGLTASRAADGTAGGTEDAGAQGGSSGHRRTWWPPTTSPCLLHNDVNAGNVLVVNPPGRSAEAPVAPAPGALHTGLLIPPAPSASPATADAAAAAATPSSTTSPCTAAPAPPAACAVELRLLDFADAGHGDPLFDFLAVAGSCLKWDPALLAATWASYRTTGPPGAVRALWPPGRGGGDSGSGGGVALSKVALCYSLLYEDEPLLSLLRQARPEAVDGAASLEELATAAWGFLDVSWTD